MACRRRILCSFHAPIRSAVLCVAILESELADMVRACIYGGFSKYFARVCLNTNTMILLLLLITQMEVWVFVLVVLRVLHFLVSCLELLRGMVLIGLTVMMGLEGYLSVHLPELAMMGMGGKQLSWEGIVSTL